MAVMGCHYFVTVFITMRYVSCNMSVVTTVSAARQRVNDWRL